MEWGVYAARPVKLASRPPLSQFQWPGRCSWAFAVPASTGFLGVPAQPPTLAISHFHVMSSATPQLPQPQPLRRAALGIGMAGVPVGMHDFPLPPSEGGSAGGRGAALRMRVRMGRTGLPVLVPGELQHSQLHGCAGRQEMCCIVPGCAQGEVTRTRLLMSRAGTGLRPSSQV